jgi:hypothetical protein
MYIYIYSDGGTVTVSIEVVESPVKGNNERSSVKSNKG